MLFGLSLGVALGLGRKSVIGVLHLADPLLDLGLDLGLERSGSGTGTRARAQKSARGASSGGSVA